jgi:asparagine synthase (glutamine-hydrolysing)
LSGGIDSSSVIGLMQSVSDRPIRTFTIGFRDATFNEAQYAREVARHLGTDHTEVELAPAAALDLVENVADWFDEPFADASQLPTYLVARTTRQHVTVALSGDGGDELFGGYPKYDMISRLWRRVGGLPQGLRAALASVLAHIPEPALRMGAACLMDAGRAERIGEKTRRLSAALQAPDSDSAALAIACVGTDHELLLNGAGGTLRLEPLAGFERLDDLALRMQAHDSITYLPDDILTKVDRCSMAVGLEARGPLLDHRLVEFVWSLPAAIRYGDGRPKALLRAVLDRYVPRALTERPKRGFSVPLAAWLSGPLRTWAEDLLSGPGLAADGLFDTQRVRAFWQRHLDGREQNPTTLWNLLMVRAWSKRWLA